MFYKVPVHVCTDLPRQKADQGILFLGKNSLSKFPRNSSHKMWIVFRTSVYIPVAVENLIPEETIYLKETSSISGSGKLISVNDMSRYIG